jgi:hypothetical protein
MESGCYSMNLPTGQMVVGTGNGALIERGIIKKEDAYGIVDDSLVNPRTLKCKTLDNQPLNC